MAKLNYDQYDQLQSLVTNMQAEGDWDAELDAAYSAAHSKLLEQQPELAVQRSLKKAGMGGVPVGRARIDRPTGLAQNVNAEDTEIGKMYKQLEPAFQDREMATRLLRDVGGPATLISGESLGQAMVEAQPDIPGLRAITSGFQQSIGSSTSLLARVLQDEEAAQRFSAATGQVEESDQSFGSKTLAGAVRSMTDVFTAGGTGPIGVIGLFTAKATNDAVDEGREAGLEGADLARYALGQGAAEGLVTAAFQKLGLGGLESTFSSPAKAGVKSALQQFGYRSLAELPEEILVDLSQRTLRWAEGIDQHAFDPDRLADDFMALTAQTLLTMGLSQAVTGGGGQQQEPGQPGQPGQPAPGEGLDDRILGTERELTPEEQAYGGPLPEGVRGALPAQPTVVEGGSPAQNQRLTPEERAYGGRLPEGVRGALPAQDAAQLALPPGQPTRFIAGEDGTLDVQNPVTMTREEQAYGEQLPEGVRGALEQKARFEAGPEGISEVQTPTQQPETSIKVERPQFNPDPKAGARQLRDQGYTTTAKPSRAAEILAETFSDAKMVNPDSAPAALREIVAAGEKLNVGGVNLYKGGQGTGFFAGGQLFLNVDKATNLGAVREVLAHEAFHAVQSKNRSLAAKVYNLMPERMRTRLGKNYTTNLRMQAEAAGDPASVQALNEILNDPAKLQSEVEAYAVGKLLSSPAAFRAAFKQNRSAATNLLEKVARVIRNLTVKGRIANQAIDTFNQMAAEYGVGTKTETPQFSPDNREARLRSQIAELKGKLSRATGKEARVKIKDDLAQKQASLAQVRAAQFMPDAKSIKERIVYHAKNVDSKFNLSAGLSDLITPISTTIRNISPKLYKRMTQFELRVRVQREDLREAVKPFLVAVDRLPKEQSDKFSAAVLSGKMDQAESVLKAAGGDTLVSQFQDARKVLDNIHNALRRSGVSIGKLDDYWPRAVKDYAAWRKQVKNEEVARIEDAITREKQKKGRDLFDWEEVDLVNRILQGYGPRKPGQTGFTHSRRRSNVEVTEDMLNLYQTPAQSMFDYINRSVNAFERAKLFGKGNVDVDIAESIGRYVRDMVKSGELKPADQEQIMSVLNARFTLGEIGPGPAARLFRDLGYATVLANPISALTQFGDLALSMTKNGVIPTFANMSASKRARITMETLGVERVAAEFEGAGWTARTLDRLMNVAGFNRVDRLGKQTFLNSSFKKYRRAALNPDSTAFKRFERDYRPVFGTEFDKLVGNLRDDAVTENVRLLMLMELSGVQPVTLNEMPKMYLMLKNGRLAYMLKTFTIKQLDFVRREMVSKIATGTRTGDMALVREGGATLLRYMMLMGMSGFGIDMLKDWIMGKTLDPEDTAIDNLLKLFGANKYMLTNAGREGIGRTALEYILPPTSLIDDPTSLRNLPIIGNLIYWRVGKGGEKVKKAERARALELAVEAMRLGERDSVNIIIDKYNAERAADQTKLTTRDVRAKDRAGRRKAPREIERKAAEYLLIGDEAAALQVINRFNANRNADDDEASISSAEREARTMKRKGRTQ